MGISDPNVMFKGTDITTQSFLSISWLTETTTYSNSYKAF